MLNIVIPMAGAGSRFSSAGYLDPKPLIRIHDVPMIRLVIENLRPKVEHRFIFICQAAHVSSYNLRPLLETWAPGAAIVELNGVTDGAARTVLAAKSLINNQDQLMIANSDQFVDVSIDKYLDQISEDNLDGLIMTMTAHDPKWSFVGFDQLGNVTSVVEKEVISDEATVGIYNFSKGEDFVSAAESMIEQDLRVNGEFYVAPVYNTLIAQGRKIGVHNIGSDGAGMYGLGIPSDLNAFVSLDLSRQAVEGLL